MLSATFLPGPQNLWVDAFSHWEEASVRWILHPVVLESLVTQFGLPDTDLFVDPVLATLMEFLRSVLSLLNTESVVGDNFAGFKVTTLCRYKTARLSYQLYLVAPSSPNVPEPVVVDLASSLFQE